MKQSAIQETQDYSIFVHMPGNRKVDEAHVGRLKARLEKAGNLTNVFPIIVNERMEVIDGQHRLAALEQLGWPVCYEMKESLTIEAVRALNNGGKNWSWKDWAMSYSELGYDAYTRFLNMINHFELQFAIVLLFATNQDRPNKAFSEGELKLSDQKKAFDQLAWLKELFAVLDSKHHRLPFSEAAKRIFGNPIYDHTRMKRKLEQYAETHLAAYSRGSDYLRALEDIYNKDRAENARQRLF